MRTTWLPLPLLALTTGCVITIGDDVDDEVGESGDGSSSQTGESGSTDAGTSDATSTDAGTSDATSTDAGTTDATSTDSTTTETGGEECPAPADPPATFSYWIEIPNAEPWDTDVAWTCTITALDIGANTAIQLDCPEAMGVVTLDVTASPAFVPPLAVDQVVDLRYVSEGPWWFNTYLRVDLQGFGHLLTIVDGDALLPPDPYVFELPFPITTASGLCTPMPGGCGDLERLALDFTVNAEAVRMFEPEYAIVGGDPGTEVWVASAGHLHDIQCTDTPDEWFRVMIANTGWE